MLERGRLNRSRGGCTCVGVAKRRRCTWEAAARGAGGAGQRREAQRGAGRRSVAQGGAAWRGAGEAWARRGQGGARRVRRRRGGASGAAAASGREAAERGHGRRFARKKGA